MPQFSCIAPNCNEIRPRATPPVHCPTRDRCEFREMCDPADVESEIQSAPPPHKEIATRDAETFAPSQASPPMPAPAFPPLLLLIQGKSFEIRGETLLGRQGTVAVEIFQEHSAVSRKHCTLKPMSAGWELYADSANSPTALDGHIVPTGQSVPLNKEKHRLLLGEVLALELHLPAAPARTASPTVSDGFQGALEKFIREA